MCLIFQVSKKSLRWDCVWLSNCPSLLFCWIAMTKVLPVYLQAIADQRPVVSTDVWIGWGQWPSKPPETTWPWGQCAGFQLLHDFLVRPGGLPQTLQCLCRGDALETCLFVLSTDHKSSFFVRFEVVSRAISILNTGCFYIFYQCESHPVLEQVWTWKWDEIQIPWGLPDAQWPQPWLIG